MLGHVQRSIQNLNGPLSGSMEWRGFDDLWSLSEQPFVNVNILLLVVIRNAVKLNNFKIEVGEKIRVLWWCRSKGPDFLYKNKSMMKWQFLTQDLVFQKINYEVPSTWLATF